MKNLPSSSQGNIFSGQWFIFSVGEHTIRAWGSNISGLERVYVNNSLVSQRRGMTRKTIHSFTLEDNEYSIIFEVKSILQGMLRCSLVCNKKALMTYVSEYDMFNLVLKLLPAFAYIILSGLFVIYFKFPRLFIYLFAVIIAYFWASGIKPKIRSIE